MLDDRGYGFYSRERQETFLCSAAFRPTLGPAQPSIQFVTGALPRESVVAGLCLTIQFYLVKFKNAWPVPPFLLYLQGVVAH